LKAIIYFVYMYLTFSKALTQLYLIEPQTVLGVDSVLQEEVAHVLQGDEMKDGGCSQQVLGVALIQPAFPRVDKVQDVLHDVLGNAGDVLPVHRALLLPVEKAEKSESQKKGCHIQPVENHLSARWKGKWSNSTRELAQTVTSFVQ
jgi:hypothetical protein